MHEGALGLGSHRPCLPRSRGECPAGPRSCATNTQDSCGPRGRPADPGGGGLSYCHCGVSGALDQGRGICVGGAGQGHLLPPQAPASLNERGPGKFWRAEAGPWRPHCVLLCVCPAPCLAPLGFHPASTLASFSRFPKLPGKGRRREVVGWAGNCLFLEFHWDNQKLGQGGPDGGEED